MYQKTRHPDWRGMGHHDGKSVKFRGSYSFFSCQQTNSSNCQANSQPKRYAGGLSQRARAACCPRTKVRAVCVQELSQTELFVMTVKVAMMTVAHGALATRMLPHLAQSARIASGPLHLH